MFPYYGANSYYYALCIGGYGSIPIYVPIPLSSSCLYLVTSLKSFYLQFTVYFSRVFEHESTALSIASNHFISSALTHL